MRLALLTGFLIFTVFSTDITADENSPLQQWALPDKLEEISGLALTTDQRLLAVTDEVAIVYEIDFHNGHIVKAFALGKPTLRGDFEGIAVLNNVIWLVTSDGLLYSSVEGENGERVSYRRYSISNNKNCEIEGLAAIELRHTLLLICKNSKKKLTIIEWSPTTEKVRKILFKRKSISDALNMKRVNSTGLEIDPATGDLIVLAGVQHGIIRLTATGKFIEVMMHLDHTLHRQAEGIAITEDGRLLIADEADGTRARLSIYKQGNAD